MKLKPILLEVNLDFGVLYQTNSVLIKPFIQYYICKHFACNMYLTIYINSPTAHFDEQYNDSNSPLFCYASNDHYTILVAVII